MKASLLFLPAAMGLLLLASAGPAAEKRPAHWAFQPPVRPQLPAVCQAGQVRTVIDRFILAALEARYSGGLGLRTTAASR